ncbi:hypothetical protein [Nonomuraea maritima]|uniref:hypothetical protein n=1 Tax=Nonomuraea maritima TaxID=683260 RepID=UPI0037156255
MADTQATERGSATSNGKVPKRYTLDMPMLSIEVRKPDVSLPHVSMPHIPKPNIPMPHVSKQELGHYVDVARTVLPPPERIAYYGALGAMAALGAIDWPVAAAIGAGMMIAQRRRQAAKARDGQRETGAQRDTGAQAKKETPAEPAGRAAPRTPAQKEQKVTPTPAKKEEAAKKRTTATRQRAGAKAEDIGRRATGARVTATAGRRKNASSK